MQVLSFKYTLHIIIIINNKELPEVVDNDLIIANAEDDAPYWY